MILFFSKSQRIRMKCARYSILLACFLCSALPPCSASAEENYWQGFIDLANELNSINYHIGDVIIEIEEFKDAMLHLPGGSDVLASNPWWATNSTFVLTRQSYNFANPDDGKGASDQFSFPQFLSIWSGRLSYSENLPNASQLGGWFNRWGTNEVGRLSGQELRRRSYTWFDWMSDFMRSNMIATSAINTNELSQWAEKSGADYVEEFASDTNKVAIGRNITNQLDNVLTEIDDTSSGVETAADNLFSSLHVDRVLPESYTGGDPTLEIFPESTIGGVHVSAVRGTLVLPNGVAYWVNTVARFIWSVIFLAMIIGLIQREYTYYTSLGHTEGAA